ncbi:MAG: DUF2384 domain-containing protein [Candidatus Eremiobacteraeota bacterium]|nr:DUF2384 domain-containing protein [Candidatus Eremiobacteraeota bacterium]MBV8375336.1 DUF2384 domain-containing protein [Candidatus Eremiobacteraeota bacterium]
MSDTALSEPPADVRRVAPTALRAFERLADAWELSNDERRRLLGDLPSSTYFKYRRAPEAARLNRDTLERISHLLGIFKSINVLLPRKESADAWIRRPNAASLFKGRSALDYILSGGFAALVDVRRYLDTQRGW